MNQLLTKLPTKKQIEKELCERSLSEYFKKAWGVVEPSTELKWNWHVDVISEHLQAVKEGKIKRLLINVPPRMLKSKACTIMFPTWCWIDNPHLKFINLSYSDSLSKGHNIEKRDIITSDWYQEHWGDRFQLKDDVNTQKKFINDKFGSMLSTSIGGTLTGEGADIIVVDDPHNPKQANSDAERTKAVEFFRTTLQTRLNNPTEGAIIVVMQRLHEEDVSGHILAKEAGYVHLKLQMEAEEDRRIILPVSKKEIIINKGDLLHEDRYDKQAVEELKTSMGSYAYAGQMQQNPAPAGGGLFKEYWWNYWKPKGVELPPVQVKDTKGNIVYKEAIDLPDDLEEQAQSWDMAFKNKKENDFVAGGVWGKKGADRFFIDLSMQRAEFTETLDMVRNLTKAYPQAKRKIVEDKANGPAIISMLKSEISGLIEHNPGSDSKEARAAAITPMVESGNVYIPHPALKPWVESFIVNASKFPLAAHDDDVDQMSQILNYWEGKQLPAWLR